jgi:hypothetical protein
MSELFDVADIEVTDTFDVTINDPKTGEPILVGGTEIVDPETGEKRLVGGDPITVTVYGPGSKQFKAAQAAQSNRNMKRLRARGGNSETTADEEAADTASFLSACTVSFNNFTYRGLPADEKPTFQPCTPIPSAAG